MTRVLSLLGLLAAVAAVAACACLLTMRLAQPRARMSHGDAHVWIHTQIALSAEQETQLVPIEDRYRAQKKHLGELIRLANMELAEALLKDMGNSPGVRAATTRIHEAQGQLQEVTLQHVLEMKPVLRADQYEKLLSLTANALYEVNHAQ